MIDWWNQVSATVSQGLGITIVGMTLVFLTLGLVIVAMVLLTKLPWLQVKEDPTEQEEEAAPAAVVEQSQPVQPAVAPDDELAQVAAIAVALLRSTRPTMPFTRGLARPQVRATGAWRTYGRAQQIGL